MFLNPYCCGWFFHICAIQNCSKNKKDFKSLQHLLLCIPSPVSFQFPSPFLTAMGTASKASTWDVNVKFGNTWEQKGEPSSASCDEAHRTCKKIKAGTGLCLHIGKNRKGLEPGWGTALPGSGALVWHQERIGPECGRLLMENALRECLLWSSGLFPGRSLRCGTGVREGVSFPVQFLKPFSGAGTPGLSLVVLVRCAPASELRSGPPAGC